MVSYNKRLRAGHACVTATAAALMLAAGLPGLDRAAAQGAAQSGGAGRFVPLGVTDAARVWKASHPRDSRFIYLLDSATGRIQICSDWEGLCRSITASVRKPSGTVSGRFAPLSVTRAPDSWRAMHPNDAHLVYSLDSTTAQIQACGDMEAACAPVGNGIDRQATAWPKLVMLYRRADSAAIAGRMYDRFVAHYGTDAVFMDIYNIPYSTDWREQVHAMSVHGGLIVALIGPHWRGQGPDGHVRIDDADDPVRTELETAFDAKVTVFPVLVEGATMPRAAELPESLKKLADINAATVDTGRDFDAHMARLIASFDSFLARGANAAASK